VSDGDRAVDPRELARLLRQRAEMGHGPLFLDGMDRREALALARPAQASHRPQAGAKVEGAQRTTRSGVPAGDAGEAGASPKQPPPAERALLPVLDGDLDALRAAASSCIACRLHSGRTQAVFSDGSPDARLMVVGEAPGANEDATGLPFVGQAGKLLDLMLASVGLSRRDSVYICNVIKCRPPGNRNPAPDEIAACSPFLRRQIELVKPEALLAVGSFSAQLLTGTEKPIGKLRGEVYSYEGVPLVITYHPAALLRNPGWSRSAWDDLQLLRQVMEGH